MDPLEAAIEDFISLAINCDSLEECFAGFIKTSPKNDLRNRKNLENKFVLIFKNIPAIPLKSALQFYIHRLANVTNYNQSNLLFGFLERIIAAELIKPMIVCQLILSDNFVLENEVYWVNGLNFIQRILVLQTVRYKEVRDILMILLTKISLIPIKSSKSLYKQVGAFCELISFILDREASLLPAYMALDEIQNKFFTDYPNGHWVLSKRISAFIDSFRPIAKIVSHSGRPRIMPVVGYCFPTNSLKLDEKTAKFELSAKLPYDRELNEPQSTLLLHIIEQNNSRETIANILSLGKAKDSMLRENRSLNIIQNLMIELIISTVEKSCKNKALMDSEDFGALDLNDTDNGLTQIVFLWMHITSTCLYFAFQYQSICFAILINDLFEVIHNSDQVTNEHLLKCREFLMWTLLQMLSCLSNTTTSSGTGDSNHTPNESLRFLSLLKFFDLLYQETEPLPLPDFNRRNSVYIMSAASIYIFLTKNDLDGSKIQLQIPIALRSHVEYLRTAALSSTNSFSMAITLNSYSSNMEIFTKMYRFFLENVLDQRSSSTSATTSSTNSDVVAQQQNNSRSPISLDILDSLTVTTRKSLTSTIMKLFVNIVQNKSNPTFPSYLAETYCRLISNSEIEVNETKILNQLMLSILRNQGWSYLYNLLELYSYRLHRINCANQLQLLRQLYSKSYTSQINHIQLYSFMENTTLKILYGFNCFEFIAFCDIQSKIVTETCNLLPPDSEELYKIFIYTLARAIHITGTETLSSDKYREWVKEILNKTKNLNTNIAWPTFTLQCFPSIISSFYESNAAEKEPNRNELHRSVDEEFRRWKSITHENDLIKHFSAQGTPPLIYCILYKMILDHEPIPPVSYKILDKIGVRALSNHLRTFADFLVMEFSNLSGGACVSKRTDAVNDMIWKHHIITLDKLLLCLSLRSFEDNHFQVGIFIIKLVLKNQEITNRIADFVKEDPEHWRQSNWSDVQSQFLKKYPEKYYFDHLQDVNGQNNGQQNIQPIFGNICLRLLPVLDIIIHRLIELPYKANDRLFKRILEEHGCLYKFHNQPITFLYNTLHFYESNLRENVHQFKKKLVFTIINAFKDIRPRNWAVTEPFLNYCHQTKEGEWQPGLDYYKLLIGRMVDTLSSDGKCSSSSSSSSPFYFTDYRFNEFPNVQSHVLYVTCVEILALPGRPTEIADNLINVVVQNHKDIPRPQIELWINAIGLIFTALPESYSRVLKEKFIDLLKNVRSLMGKNFLYLFDFKQSFAHYYENDISYILALIHSYWNHGTFGHLCSMSQFIKEKIQPIVEYEEQLMVVCYFVGPFLQRLRTERVRCVIEIAQELFQMLEKVDKKCPKLQHIDTICDLFYHFKYQFTGNSLKEFIDEWIKKMRPELQKKLRFLSQASDDNN